jgi:hypothetical protein
MYAQLSLILDEGERVPPVASAMMCIADASWSVPNRSARA